jgi:hypothetical protein
MPAITVLLLLLLLLLLVSPAPVVIHHLAQDLPPILQHGGDRLSITLHHAQQQCIDTCTHSAFFNTAPAMGCWITAQVMTPIQASTTMCAHSMHKAAQPASWAADDIELSILARYKLPCLPPSYLLCCLPPALIKVTHKVC